MISTALKARPFGKGKINCFMDARRLCTFQVARHELKGVDAFSCVSLCVGEYKSGSPVRGFRLNNFLFNFTLPWSRPQIRQWFHLPTLRRLPPHHRLISLRCLHRFSLHRRSRDGYDLLRWLLLRCLRLILRNW